MKTDPTVLFAARRMPPAVGGIERFSGQVWQALSDQFSAVDLSNRNPRRNEAVYILGLRGRIRHALRDRSSTVLDGSDATVSFAFGAFRDVPSIVRIHGLDITHPNPVYRRLVARYLPRVSWFVANSGPTARLLVDRGIPEQRIRIVHPAADTPPGFSRSPVRGRILLVGRLVERKGFARFVERIWPLVCQESADASLHIVGDGEMRPRMAAAIQKAPRKDRIVHLGRVDDVTLNHEFAEAACLAMPNQPLPGDWEGFGITAIEAAVRGVPVVASAIEGIVDAVVDGVTGRLVRSADDAAFADAVLRTMERDGGAASQRLQQFATQRWGTQRLSREYGRVVQDAAQAGRQV